MLFTKRPTSFAENFSAVPVARVKEIIDLNKSGQKPDALLSEKEVVRVEKTPDYENVVGQDSLTRFDKSRNKKKKRKPDNRNRSSAAPEGQNRPNPNPNSNSSPNRNRQGPPSNQNRNRNAQ